MKKIIFIFLVVLFVGPLHNLAAVQDLTSIENWVEIIQNGSDEDFKNLFELEKELSTLDPSTSDQVLKRIETLGPKNNPIFKIRLKYLQLKSNIRTLYPSGLEEVLMDFDELIQLAYLTGNDLLLAQCYKSFGSVMFAYNQFDLALAYTQTSIGLQEKLPVSNNLSLDYILLGEILFHTRDYPASIKYTLQGLDLGQLEKEGGTNYIRYLNTVGQSYLQLNKLDSASYFFESAYEQAELLENQVWMGINSSYLGQVNFLKGDLDKSKKQLLFDYQINKDIEFNIAGNSMNWLAKIYLKNGNLDSAKICVEKSIGLLQRLNGKVALQTSKFLEDAYFLKSEIFRNSNRLDSALFYFQRYSEVHESNERLALLSSNQVTKTKVSNEKNQYALLTIQRKIEAEEKVRNSLIVIILVISLISGLLLIFKQKQIKYKNEILRLQEAAAAVELNQAKKQIGEFTSKLLEKATLLENLENKFSEREFTEERQQYLTELSQQKILTEEDWQKFKSLFEKLHPGFFILLGEKFPDITLAEKRIAALILLQLTAQEMASILGISPDSAHRTRLRLRKRLGLGSETNLFEHLQGLTFLNTKN